MRVVLCMQGMRRIREVLAELLPEDDVDECAADAVADVAATADVLVPTIAPVTAAAFAGPRVKLVQQFGVGLDSIDIPAATRAGVLVANVPSSGTGNAESVAEFAVAQMLMLCRRIPQAMTRFAERRVGGPVGTCLWESTVVILGYGGVGQEIARRLAGFGVRVIAVSRHGPDGGRVRDAAVPLAAHVTPDALGQILPEADFLVVGAPASAENVGLVGRELLGLLKPGAWLVNVARGPVVDYEALCDALASGRLAGAALDVFWQEPFDPGDPLLGLNVIATPHVAGVTDRSFRGIGEAVAANVERIRRGELPADCANPEAGTGRLS